MDKSSLAAQGRCPPSHRLRKETPGWNATASWCCRCWDARRYSLRGHRLYSLGQHKVLSTFALEADVNQRLIPSVFNGAIEAGPCDGGWYLHHHRPIQPGIDEEVHVTCVDVGCRRLVLPATPFRPPDDVIVACLAVAEGGLLHRVLAHEGKTPDHCVHGAAVHGTASQLLGC